MSETAILDTAEALRSRIGLAVEGLNHVHLGPPLRNEVGSAKASLFLFHLVVNRELRNELRLAPPPDFEPATEPGDLRDALPLDLRFLITVFGVGQVPLTTLGQIVQVLQAQPTLSGEGMKGQTVRVSPEPYPMEELSRVWGLFPQDVYRTSVVYLASPVIVEGRTWPVGPPVQQRRHRDGLATDPPDLFGEGTEVA